MSGDRRRLSAVGLESSAESPLPVRTVSAALVDWIGRLGSIWIEGQVTQVSRRPGMQTAWVTLRDPEVEMSLSVVTQVGLLDRLSPPLAEGQRIVVWGQPEFYAGRGSLQVRAREIRAVGRGALLEQLERLRALLAAEGLFAEERKRPLPFLPRRIGLVSGRASAALQDVLVNARLRWPRVDFEVREVAVQGAMAVEQVVAALGELNAIPDVDVIVIARGGGSVEDLLPFSNEALIRAVAASRAPVVTAIGHEQDVPLVDLVADLRASTPTDAAKRIVPDLEEQARLLDAAVDRIRAGLRRRIVQDAERMLAARDRGRRALRQRVTAGSADLAHLRARLHALSPAATLDRGYALVQAADGTLVRDAAEVAEGAPLRIRVAHGEFPAVRRDRA